MTQQRASTRLLVWSCCRTSTCRMTTLDPVQDLSNRSFVRNLLSHFINLVANLSNQFLTAQRYASTVCALVIVVVVCVYVSFCVCLVCLFLTCWYCFNTAERRVMQTPPHDSPGTLVFWYQRSGRNLNRSHPTVVPNAVEVCYNRLLLTNNWI